MMITHALKEIPYTIIFLKQSNLLGKKLKIYFLRAGMSPPEDDELTLPRASINKMIKEILPHVRVANESRELILNCCTEFIHLISSEANDICNQQQKKTINAEHILQALEKLGFSDYSAEAEAVLRDCKAVAAKRRRQSTRLENLGIPEEELLRQQQELFAKAREEQAVAEQIQWQQLQAVSQMSSMMNNDNDQDDYS
ncbi:PREDICTED: protein Dr1 isoform X1 [Ceratosolen solmsi marchali]|uniref:Protein Dr1 n=1 Tax=Ceratosolen solmsi marchali TaxID=326594 RepID=A0AAJ6VKG9_9HYME|nr:PREDICTED: protein Dr1 isoform X1 [Ceratosolen solmsi marchali]